jgi:hypothetical protein
MLNFKDWFYAEDMNTIGGPQPQMQSANPTGDKKALTAAVQGTMQDPSIPKIASTIQPNNKNPNIVQQQVLPIAQNFLKKNPNVTTGAPITAVDIAKQVTPQLNGLTGQPNSGIGMNR